VRVHAVQGVHRYAGLCRAFIAASCKARAAASVMRARSSKDVMAAIKRIASAERNR